MTEVSSSSQQTAKQIEKENRQIVTPYAFHVSAELFGTPLASPARRAIAILIDLFLIALLSDVTGNFLAVLSAALLIFVSRRMTKNGKPKMLINLLRGLSALLILLAIFGVYDHLQRPAGQQPTVDKSENVLITLALGGKYLLEANNIPEKVAAGKCVSEFECWDKLSNELAHDLVSAELTSTEVSVFVEEFSALSSESLTKEQSQKLKQYVIDIYNELNDAAMLSTDADTDSDTDRGFNLNNTIVDEANEYEPTESKYTILNWIKGVAAEFGIGFGWAALYFTALTGLLKGQTLGKKLLGIKIIKLDGSAMTTWESFGRYGGYGAGIATGLMGFLQIYWDPNRQAIQDKISETLVIDIRASRLAELNEMNEK